MIQQVSLSPPLHEPIPYTIPCKVPVGRLSLNAEPVCPGLSHSPLLVCLVKGTAICGSVNIIPLMMGTPQNGHFDVWDVSGASQSAGVPLEGS